MVVAYLHSVLLLQVTAQRWLQSDYFLSVQLHVSMPEVGLCA